MWNAGHHFPNLSIRQFACLTSLHPTFMKSRMTVRRRKRRLSCSFFVFLGALPQAVWPMKRRQLNAMAASQRNRAFVLNVPLGMSSTPMSLFSSLWNCSLVPCAW